jgi:CubicO group peptidase (beta-lactamase class C family)
MLVSVFSLLASGGITADDFRIALQPIIDAKAKEWNTSFSLGLYSSNVSIGISAGLNDRVRGTSVTPQHRYPLGSVTKTFTAAAIMQQQQAGQLDIDAPIHRYVDPVLQQWNGTTMLRLWNNDSQILSVTARMLMGMTGGLRDYNDTAYEDWTVEHPHEDWTPFDMLHALDKTFICTPGNCTRYSSPGYNLLGLALVYVNATAHNGSVTAAWEDYEQLSVLPAPLRMNLNGTTFPMRGQCSLDPLMVHQYRPVVSAGPSRERVITVSDIYNDSCLNGWTCGNIAATPIDVARFYYELFHGRVVSNESLRSMATMHDSKIPFPKIYGLGLMPVGAGVFGTALPAAVDPANMTHTVGHAGGDWGSQAWINGYNSRLNLGISLATNAAMMGLNCTKTWQQSHGFYADVACAVYDAVINVVLGGTSSRLNCSAATPVPLPPRPPSPDCFRELEQHCKQLPPGAPKSNITTCAQCVVPRCTGTPPMANCSLAQELQFCGLPPAPPSAFSCRWAL